MAKSTMVYLIVMVLLTFPLTGCVEEAIEEKKIQAEELIEVENPCLMPSEPVLQSMTTIPAHGVDRYFRLTVPSSEAGTMCQSFWLSMAAAAQRKISHNKMNSML